MKGLRKAALVVALSVAAIQLAGCGSSGTSTVTTKLAAAGTSAKSEVADTSSKSCRIGLSDGVSDSVEQSYLASIARAEAKRKGCELVLGTASGDPAQQFDQVQQWIEAKQVDAIVFLPTGGDPTPLIKQAQAAGIPVIGYSGPLPGGSGAINYNNELAGQQLASAAIAWPRATSLATRSRTFPTAFSRSTPAARLAQIARVQSSRRCTSNSVSSRSQTRRRLPQILVSQPRRACCRRTRISQ